MRKQRLNLWQVLLLFAFLASGLYWGDKRGWFDGVRGRIEEGVIWLRSYNNYNNYSNYNSYKAEEKARLLSLEEKVWELEKENQELRKQLGAPLPAQMKFVPAKVLGSLGSLGNFGEILVGVGKREGVVEGMAVVVENILLGKVSQVTSRMSQVRLLIDFKSKVTVKTERGARGIIMGNSKFQISNFKSIPNSKFQMTNSILLDRVLQSEELTVGEKVLTSGEDGLPPDLLVGKLVEVLVEEREPFKRAIVELFIEAGEVERVFIISNF